MNNVNNTAIVTHSVSLSLILSSSTFSSDYGRVTSRDSIDLYNNKARSDMLVGLEGSEAVPAPSTTGPGTRHGTSIAVNTTEPLADVFAGWSNSVWDIPAGNLVTGGPLPTLRNMPEGPHSDTNPPLLP